MRLRQSMNSSHLFSGLAGLLSAARRRHREREELSRLEDRDLHDFGATRSAIAYELNKPFWHR